MHFKTGDIYFGNFNTKTRRNGKGVNLNTDGTIYAGEWIDNVKHGTGTLYPNSKSYDKDKNEIKEQIES